MPLILLAMIILLILTLIFGINGIIFVLNLAQNHWDGAPGWLNSGNIMGWIVMVIVMTIAFAVIKKVTMVVKDILVAIVRSILPNNGLVIITLLTLFVAYAIFGLFLTQQFFDWSAQFSAESAFFASPSWWVKVGVFLVIFGLICPSPEDDDKKVDNF